MGDKGNRYDMTRREKRCRDDLTSSRIDGGLVTYIEAATAKRRVKWRAVSGLV